MKQAKTHIGVALVTAAVSVLTTLEAGALAGGGPCVDFDSALGPVRPLHQAGQPPMPMGEIGWGEKMFHYLPEAGIRYSRLHDTGGEIRNITIRNVRGTFYRYAVGLTHFFRWDPSKPRGRMDDITIEGCSIGKCETPAHFPGVNPPVSLISVEEKLDVGTLRVLNASRTGTLEAEKPTLFIEPKAVVSNLVIRGCKVPFLENRGEVKNLVSGQPRD